MVAIDGFFPSSSQFFLFFFPGNKIETNEIEIFFFLYTCVIKFNVTTSFEFYQNVCIKIG